MGTFPQIDVETTAKCQLSHSTDFPPVQFLQSGNVRLAPQNRSIPNTNCEQSYQQWDWKTWMVQNRSARQVAAVAVPQGKALYVDNLMTQYTQF